MQPVNRRTFLSATLGLAAAHAETPYIDLLNAALILPDRLTHIAALFKEEAEKRTSTVWSNAAGAARIVFTQNNPNNSEAFTIASSNNEVRIEAHSDRGLLYAAGHLLRNIEFTANRALLPLSRANLTSAPHFPLRGHQLGYRPKTNSYDGWNIADWRQYIRDLAVFGINAIEILPPRTDDEATSPHFPLPPEQMIVEQSRIAAELGLAVWLWFPALDNDYTRPETLAASLKEWGAVFEKLPRLDAVFTPGGDPGDTSPAGLLSLLEKQKRNLRRYHPDAQMWVSPQSFSETQLHEFIAFANSAAWLDGVVHGPQCRIALPDLRQKLRASLPIRLYPDITHSLQCQFPVPNWHRAFAATEGRECINPRPVSFAAIARQYLPYTNGFIAYSEGCNDDVNKAVWNAAAWNPGFDIDDCLAEYSRYFIGSEHATSFARGLRALEQNWQPPFETSALTLERFRSLEEAAAPETLRNWRFQQALYRACFDAYSIGRLTGPPDPALRVRILELGEALFQSIHMQLDVEHYRAESVSRGANLDTLDAALSGPAHSTEAGQGSFYDDLGNPQNRPHLLMPKLSEPDPEFRRSVLTGFLYPDSLGPNYPVNWRRWAETLFDTPLELRYQNLDPGVAYKIKIVYSGDARKARVRLTAAGIEIHPLMQKPWPPQPVEFNVPREVTASGDVTFSFTRELGLGGNGRGCQLSEVWLIRQ